jgi:hypothetical protein
MENGEDDPESDEVEDGTDGTEYGHAIPDEPHIPGHGSGQRTLAATSPLSPVIILTSTPSRWSWTIDEPGSAFGRSAVSEFGVLLTVC